MSGYTGTCVECSRERWIKARGLCWACLRDAPRVQPRRDVEATKEDAAFLADHRVSGDEAAGRLGFASWETLQRWLERNGCQDVSRRLGLHRREYDMTG